MTYLTVKSEINIFFPRTKSYEMIKRLKNELIKKNMIKILKIILFIFKISL